MFRKDTGKNDGDNDDSEANIIGGDNIVNMMIWAERILRIWWVGSTVNMVNMWDRLLGINMARMMNMVVLPQLLVKYSPCNCANSSPSSPSNRWW